ncbi:MAG: tetratricopeptide repeat protein [Acidobacteria bacterium]|jgi:Flp pilus assembly protein TadD|nr:tetratricopeptide repeat protein [Thermoanaerobaculia bacterium]MDI9631741.1 tetratricopeptide repeat protein [Acidobacteriota bacterium]OQC42431.1 MAG: Tetratricopeptide repeat protein [Acidobacteria bacterium ADurb.Bin051]MBP7813224.1 tetratricopeptide repeat protein [Thermoanaerobaculia bacterium]MBP8845019.1 tetratricopeptide repeat protein [Thermoanaerobaculia bacterium]
MAESARRILMLMALALAMAGCGSARPAKDAASQARFGIEMARRGLWSEALFRFQAAGGARPDDARLLNNQAVALEALGRFDEALAAYREALRLAPENRQVRQNFNRFNEFYQGFRPPPPAPAPTP